MQRTTRPPRQHSGSRAGDHLLHWHQHRSPAPSVSAVSVSAAASVALPPALSVPARVCLSVSRRLWCIESCTLSAPPRGTRDASFNFDVACTDTAEDGETPKTGTRTCSV